MRRRSTKRVHTIRRKDCRVLAEALNDAGASNADAYAASILLAANDLRSALAYVGHVRKRNRVARRSICRVQKM